MIAQDKISWKVLGTGRISPPGSIPDRKLAERIAAYKSQVAGRYRSVAPQDILKAIPPGEHIVSPKIDGETWFFSARDDKAWLLSPSGKIITDIPVTDHPFFMVRCGNQLTLYGKAIMKFRKCNLT